MTDTFLLFEINNYEIFICKNFKACYFVAKQKLILTGLYKIDPNNGRRMIMRKWMAMLAAALAFTTMTTVYAQKNRDARNLETDYDWNNPSGFSRDGAIYVIGTTEYGKLKLYPGERPARFGDKDIIQAQKPGDVDEIWAGMRNEGGEDSRAFTLVSGFWPSNEVWKKFTFAFKPHADGKVIIAIGRQGGHSYWSDDFKKNMVNYSSMLYGSFEIKGAKLKALTLQNENDLKAWGVTVDKKIKENSRIWPVFMKGATAPGGRTSVKLFGNLSQMIDVKKGQQVEISFYAYAGPVFNQLR